MRILQLGNLAPAQGGISSVLLEFSSWDWGEDEFTFVDTYATDTRLFGLRRLVAASGHLWRHRREIDVVHLHLSQRGSFVREGGLVLLSSMLVGRTVVTMHGSGAVKFIERRPRLVRLVLSRADVVSVLYQDMVEVLSRANVRAKVYVVPNAMRAPDSATALPSRSQLVVFAGEVSERKGADTLLRAWGQVVQRFPSAELHFYGDVKISTESPPKGVQFHGPVSRPEVLAAMGHARVVVLPSRAEAFPMTLVEAAALGRPMIVTSVAGMPSIARDDRQIVGVDDDVQLMATMVRFFSSDEIVDELGAANLRHFASHMSDRSAIGQWRQIYRSVGS